MVRIAAGNPSAWTGPEGNNTYLLCGRVPTLIDAGVGERSHLEALERALAGAPLAQVLITHGHPDHVGGLPSLRARWPALRVRNADGDRCRDGELVPAGDTQLRALFTPGHAPDHFCFFDAGASELYCGDLARRDGTIVIPASSGGDLVQYLSSLRRVRDMAPRRLLPGHGPPIDAVTELLDQYLRHRDGRDVQILAALRSGCTTLDSIVAVVYPDLDPAVVRGARESVLAHLHKLEHEGKVVGRAGGWVIA